MSNTNPTTDGRPLPDHFDDLEGAIKHFFKVVELDYYDSHNGNDIARYEDAKNKVMLFLARAMENTALCLNDLEGKIRSSEFSRKTLERYNENRDLAQEYPRMHRF